MAGPIDSNFTNLMQSNRWQHDAQKLLHLKEESGAVSGQSIISQSNSVGVLKNLPNAAEANHKKMVKVSQEFEAIFIQQLMEQMDKTVDREDSLLSSSQGEEMFRGMFNQEIAMKLSQQPGGSGFGLAQAVYRELAHQSNSKQVEPQ